jgi:glycosyltransferase involved in cell wall biosynthesis
MTEQSLAPAWTENSFAQIFLSHRGKVSDKWQSYIPVYESIFAEYRDKQVSLLEIGIQNGGSLEVYAEYFSDAAIIVGNDINPRCRLLSYPPCIRVVVGSCVDEQTKGQITAISPSFDIVVDDGSHTSKDIILAFLKYFPIVNAGGIYIIEDLHASYWQDWGGGLFHKKSSVAFLKLLVDAVNAEHWGVSESITDFMTLGFPDYQPLYDESVLGEIKSITFSNSMCIIRKTGPAERNTLGPRVVRGTEALVVENLRKGDGSPPRKANERRNLSSVFSNRLTRDSGSGEIDPADVELSIAAVMPVYNGERYLREAIQSVIGQSLKPNEFIIVDDGSTDNGHVIIEEMSREYPITFIRKGRNEGQSATRNFAVSRCKSNLIALIDQDDRWHQDHLEELIKPFLDHRGTTLGWVYSDFDDIDENGRLIARTFINRPTLQNPKKDLIQLLAQGAVTQPSATLISRAAFEKVGGFDENLSGCEDEDLFLRLFRENYDNVYIAQSLSQWRVYDGSHGASSRMDKSQRHYIRKLIAEFPDDKWRGHYYVRDVIAPRFVRTLLYMYLRAGRYKNYEKMREYAWDIWSLIGRLRFGTRVKLALAFPILLWPRAGGLFVKVAARYRHVLGF